MSNASHHIEIDKLQALDAASDPQGGASPVFHALECQPVVTPTMPRTPSAKDREDIPQEIWDDLTRHSRFIFAALLFLNGSVLWAYYSCLSAQDFFSLQFPETDFTFLTTLVTSWPLIGGHAVQMLMGWDKTIPHTTRVLIGYTTFMAMALAIMLCSAIRWGPNPTTGATLVLVCIGITGAAISITQSVFYGVAALFPTERFTNAVQIGNVGAGVINVTLSTGLRLAIGGVNQTSGAQKTSFYLFFGILAVVCVSGIVLYRRLMQLRCVAFLVQRSTTLLAAQRVNSPIETVPQRLRDIWRVFCIVQVPAVVQFLVFFVSLAVFPGVGCAAGRVLEDDDVAGKWYCSPGIIGTFSYGDCIGRVVCTAAVYRVLTMRRSFVLTVLRVAFIPLLLINVHGSTLYVFGDATPAAVPLVYGLVMNVLMGITGGILSTVTIGGAPLMVPIEDRPTASAVTLLFTFAGLSCGATVGYAINAQHLFGL